MHSARKTARSTLISITNFRAFARATPREVPKRELKARAGDVDVGAVRKLQRAGAEPHARRDFGVCRARDDARSDDAAAADRDTDIERSAGRDPAATEPSAVFQHSSDRRRGQVSGTVALREVD